MRLPFAIMIAISLSLLGCSKEDHQDFEPIYEVPDQHQLLVDQFIEEAANRGVELHIDNLIILEDSQMSFEACGDCNSLESSNAVQKIVRINARGCWLNDLQKEALFFHELGHCILGRDHTSELLPNGDYKSMMAAGKIDFYSPCVYQFGEENECNFTFKRDYYLDELFRPDTPVPDWAK